MFKVGDWVIDTNENTIYQVSEKLPRTYLNKYCLLWKPKEGEFVFAKDKNKVFLVEFVGFYKNKYMCKHLGSFSETFYTIQPFIGELPSFLKDS
jgi:hypothetical protein